MWVSAVGLRQPPADMKRMNPDHNPQAARDRRQQETWRHAPRSTDELHICVICGGRLVHPFDWTAEGPGQWRVLLRCPDCEAVREGVFRQRVVDLLADEFDRGSGALIRALDLLTRENMAAEIDVLIRALEEETLLPSDF
jgi:hypothetical protein